MQRVSKYDSLILTNSEMTDYEGTYLNIELDESYSIVEDNNQLILRHLKYDDTILNPVRKDEFKTSQHWTEKVNFIRNPAGAIKGLEINSGRVLHLYYEKSA